MKECSSENKHGGFFDRKVSICHIVYIVILCAVINIFLLLICPGQINDDAFANFSFASTLISIVLAVVSIVYSLQSGLSNLGQINSIKEIESKINNELNKFSAIDDKINSALKPVNDHLCSIEKQASDIQRKQEDLGNLFL